MIQLTNERWEKFYVNSDLIEVIHPLMGGKSEVRLTTGRYVVCLENPDEIERILSGSGEKTESEQ